MTAIIERRPLMERFMEKVEKTDTCWLWTGATTSNGYGRIGRQGKVVLVHRVSYEHFVGPIPEGLQIDHLCRVRNCVNPEHLEPVTCAENQRRGLLGRLRTSCVHGHAWPEHMAVRGGQRVCVVCRREASLRYWRKVKA